ncbi:MAG: hypothetical protein K0U47_07550 [Epsilonproteobacteria bacterium]|nr:hypothetical protein [Campylobacterota bacterium]
MQDLRNEIRKKFQNLDRAQKQVVLYRYLIRLIVMIMEKKWIKETDTYLFHLLYLCSLIHLYFFQKNLTFILDLARIHARSGAHDLTQDFVRTLDLALDLALDLSRTRTNAQAFDRDRALDLSLHIVFDLGVNFNHLFMDDIEYIMGLSEAQLFNEGLYIRDLELAGLGDQFAIFKQYILKPVSQKSLEKFTDVIVNVDDKVLKQESFRSLVNYLQAELEDKISSKNSARVILLGNGGAGKTSLIAKIKNPAERVKDYEATPRIEISQMHYKGQGGDQNIEINFWDFGGQVIMHSTHTFFLNIHSSYIVTCNARSDEQPDSWLELLESSLDAKGVKVFIVYTHVDDSEDIKDFKNYRKNRLQRRFGKQFDLSFHAISNKYTEKRDFKDAFLAFRDALYRNVEKEAISDKTYTILHALYQEESRAYLSVKEIYEKYDANEEYEKTFGSREEFLKQLMAFGYVFPVIDKKEIGAFDESDLFIWQKHWLTYGVYELINSSLVKAKQGFITQDDFKEILFEGKQKYIDERGVIQKYHSPKRERIKFDTKGREVLYDLIKNYGWAIESRKVNRELILPHAVTVDEPSITLLEPYLVDERDEDNIYMVVLFDVVPKNFFFRFISLSEKHILKSELLWRSGVVLFDQMDDETFAYIVLEENKMQIKVEGKNSVFLTHFIMYYLVMLFRDYQSFQIKPQVLRQFFVEKNKEPMMINLDIISKLSSDDNLEEFKKSIQKEILIMGDTYNINGPVNNSPIGGKQNSTTYNQISKIENILEKSLQELEKLDTQEAEILASEGTSLLADKSESKGWFTKVGDFGKSLKNIDSGTEVLSKLGMEIFKYLPAG